MAIPLELTRAQCVDLLNAGVIGRVGICLPAGPRVIPVNYALHGACVVWRTSPYSELGTHGAGRNLAFEVDHIDYERHQGWSVLAVGPCQIVDDPQLLDQIRSSWTPTPWAGGQRGLYMRLTWRTLTGRLVGRDWPRDTVTPVRRRL